MFKNRLIASKNRLLTFTEVNVGLKAKMWGGQNPFVLPSPQLLFLSVYFRTLIFAVSFPSFAAVQLVQDQ